MSDPSVTPRWFHDADGQPIALWVPAAYTPSATTFLTEPDMEQQLGFLIHPAGHTVARHEHADAPRPLVGCPECLILRKGRCAVSLFGRDRQPVAGIEMGPGDLILILGGGHEFRMIEACEWIETRAGAWPADGAKVWF